MGMKLGAGVSTALDPDRVCTFKKGLTEVKLILAPPAPDAATADAYWDAERSQVPANLPVKDLKLFDRSAFGAGSAGGLSLSALFAIKGQYFFDLYCGLPGCSEDASVTAGTAHRRPPALTRRSAGEVADGPVRPSARYRPGHQPILQGSRTQAHRG